MIAKNEAAELWHKHLGHKSYSNLKILQSKEMLIGLPEFNIDKKKCEIFILSKHKRDSIPKESETRAKEKLGLIHSDVCGPMQNTSIN